MLRLYYKPTDELERNCKSKWRQLAKIKYFSNNFFSNFLSFSYGLLTLLMTAKSKLPKRRVLKITTVLFSLLKLFFHIFSIAAVCLSTFVSTPPSCQRLLRWHHENNREAIGIWCNQSRITRGYMVSRDEGLSFRGVPYKKNRVLPPKKSY